MPENDPMGYTEATDADVEAKMAEVDAAAQEQAMAEVGQAPMAQKPLSPKRVNALGKTAADAIAELSDGQMPAGEPVQVQEPVEALPAPLYAQVTAFAQVPAMAGAEQYAFDPAVESTSDEGLLKMANMINKMSTDKQVKQAMQQPVAEAEAAPAPVEEPGDEDFSAMV